MRERQKVTATLNCLAKQIKRLYCMKMERFFGWELSICWDWDKERSFTREVIDFASPSRHCPLNLLSSSLDLPKITGQLMPLEKATLRSF